MKQTISLTKNTIQIKYGDELIKKQAEKIKNLETELENFRGSGMSGPKKDENPVQADEDKDKLIKNLLKDIDKLKATEEKNDKEISNLKKDVSNKA